MAAEAEARESSGQAVLRRSGPAALFERLRSNTVRRMGWGLADQAVSSLTNYAVSLYIIRTLGAVQFGAFSLAYVTYAFALNASRGLATDPLMVRFSGTDVPTWRRAVADCTGVAVAVGAITGAGVLLAAMALHGTTRSAFIALGITLPALMLQDSWRYSFFALGRGAQAFLNDCIWAAAMLPALLALRLSHHADVFWYVIAWGAAAGVAAAVGPWQARVLPRLTGAWGWVSRHRDLGPRYLVEGVASASVLQLRSYGIVAILGLAAVGYMQTAVTLMGPINILFLGMTLVAIPEAARVLKRSARDLPKFCILVSMGLTAAAVAWGVALLIVVPRGFGHWLVGPIWRPTYPLVLPQMLSLVGQGLAGGAGVGMHALGAARRSLRSVVIGSVVFLAFALAGAYQGGVEGALWGSVVASGLGAGLTWWQLRAALRESDHAAEGGRAWTGRPEGRHRRVR
jgi:O-antigen/teichoic acid export membrane protein